MGIRVVWDNDQHTVVRYVFDRRWAWEDFFAAKRESTSQINTVQHQVGLIMDAPPDVLLPSNMLTHSRKALENRHPNICIIVFVTYNHFTRAMINTLIKLSHRSSAALYMARSLDEARSVVDAHLATVQQNTQV